MQTERRQTAVKAIVAAMNSMSKIQQEQNKLKINLLENSQKYQDNFFNTMMKSQMDREQSKYDNDLAIMRERAILPLKTQAAKDIWQMRADIDRRSAEDKMRREGQSPILNRANIRSQIRERTARAKYYENGGKTSLTNLNAQIAQKVIDGTATPEEYLHYQNVIMKQQKGGGNDMSFMDTVPSENSQGTAETEDIWAGL